MAKKSNSGDNDILENKQAGEKNSSVEKTNSGETVDSVNKTESGEETDSIDKFIKRTKLQNRILKKITITLNQSELKDKRTED